ncbi:hypothetical protein Ancab_032976 [Ancistrocladus abbreviatus]
MEKSPAPLLTKPPKSTWVNPTRPKPSVLSLQRHKRSSYSYNPQIRDLGRFAQQLNDCNASSQEAFMAVLDTIPWPLAKENALLVLNSLRAWEKAPLFFNWLKSQNLFPTETIFYNVKSANEMIDNGIEVDNILYSTIIICAKRCNLFDKAVEWFERMYKRGVMPDEVTYSAMFGDAGDYDGIRSLFEEMVESGITLNEKALTVLVKIYGKARWARGALKLWERMRCILHDIEDSDIVKKKMEWMQRKNGLRDRFRIESRSFGIRFPRKERARYVHVRGEPWSSEAQPCNLELAQLAKEFEDFDKRLKNQVEELKDGVKDGREVGRD